AYVYRMPIQLVYNAHNADTYSRLCDDDWAQARDSIKDANGEPQLLAWWKNHREQYPRLSRVTWLRSKFRSTRSRTRSVYRKNQSSGSGSDPLPPLLRTNIYGAMEECTSL
ncbi:hypothetical protein HAX54_009858, partial [Datura stramonium]|nr:hypothetical protein [Datura stramonium]